MKDNFLYQSISICRCFAVVSAVFSIKQVAYKISYIYEATFSQTKSFHSYYLSKRAKNENVMGKEGISQSIQLIEFDAPKKVMIEEECE